MPSGYNKFSPYASTPLTNGYLDILKFVDLPPQIDDIQFTITSLYMHRPDLLANDIYGDSQLWWVFAVRNKDVIRDSVYDFVPGQVIYLPKIATIKTALGF
jgi:Base plate wedge protein 53